MATGLSGRLRFLRAWRGTADDTRLRAPQGPSEAESAYRSARTNLPPALAAAVSLEAFSVRFARSGGIAARHADDLFLALACTAPEPSVARFARDRFAARASSTIARVARRQLPADEGDDFRQEMLALLCVPGYRAGGPALLEQYDGRAPLDVWVATVATRRSLNRRKSGARRPTHEPMVAEPEAPDAPMISPPVERAVRTAVAAAIDTLEPRDALALRHTVVDGASLETVGRIAYGGRISVPTVSRRVRDARAVFRRALLDQLETHVARNPALPEVERDLSHVVHHVLPRVLDLGATEASAAPRGELLHGETSHRDSKRDAQAC